MQILQTKNLIKDYSHKRVVNNLSIQICSGEIVGLLGPNGAGKTTTFYMIAGLIKPDGGKILLNDEDITSCPMSERARKGLGYLSQEPSIFRKLTVRDNIFAILETLPLTKEEREKRLLELLNELNITHLKNRKAYTLSGGEKRRVEISRALVTRPSILLLDEPFTGIDPIAVVDIQGILKDLKKKGYGVLITDHSVRETLEITDHAYIIHDGQILTAGTPKKILSHKGARKSYFGEDFSL
ncbi:LPS export ABC transporter ATP-binding protein [bacterium]|nr:LPS export ABC transporter ATP-binding protein [bacterium]